MKRNKPLPSQRRLALRRGYRSLEGMNGDIAGYALTISELCGAAVFALL